MTATPTRQAPVPAELGVPGVGVGMAALLLLAGAAPIIVIVLVEAVPTLVPHLIANAAFNQHALERLSWEPSITAGVELLLRLPAALWMLGAFRRYEPWLDARRKRRGSAPSAAHGKPRNYSWSFPYLGLYHLDRVLPGSAQGLFLVLAVLGFVRMAAFVALAFVGLVHIPLGLAVFYSALSLTVAVVTIAGVWLLGKRIEEQSESLPLTF